MDKTHHGSIIALFCVQISKCILHVFFHVLESALVSNQPFLLLLPVAMQTITHKEHHCTKNKVFH